MTSQLICCCAWHIAYILFFALQQLPLAELMLRLSRRVTFKSLNLPVESQAKKESRIGISFNALYTQLHLTLPQTQLLRPTAVSTCRDAAHCLPGLHLMHNGKLLHPFSFSLLNAHTHTHAH